MMSKNNFQVQVLSLILLSCLILCHCVKLTCNKMERQALLSFKESLSDPSVRLVSWTGNNCCKWQGVICNNKTGEINELRLENPGEGTDFSLGGELNISYLLKLKYLNYLDLSFNNFGRTKIPKLIGSLTKLRYLNLSNSNFGGTIPQTIGNLSFLQYLDLSSYTYEQANNSLQFLSGLRSLEHLNLGMVDFSEAQNKWLRVGNMFLPSLRELHMPQCGLSVIPFFLYNVNFSSSLSVLDLSFNSLQGTFPIEFANLTSLQTLDLSGNYLLRGEITKNLGNLCNLQKLDLSVNNFSGEITQLIENFASCSNTKLEILNLGSNIGLEGTLPNSIGNLTKLKILDLRVNSLTGSIPDSIGKLSSLEHLYISNSKMSGNPPESIGNLSSLVSLDMSETPWEGIMTEAHFQNLENLKELSIFKFSLSPNLSLVLNISKNWVPPFKLSFLKLRSCQVGPDFPAWLRNQNELKFFYLRNTGINDKIPDWLSELNLELEELDLGFNQISGTIPSSIRFTFPSTVYLNWNLFEGPLPLFSSNVSALYLSNNLFTGPIPVDIGERLPFLSDIDFSQNFLNGSIPLSIGKLNTLTTLVLSNNHLSGNIPDFWDNLPMLYLLELSNNTLTGQIPASMGTLNSLRFLLLSNNLLSGKIIDRLQNCTQMTTLDLGENMFSGAIPAWIGERMPSLLILRLRSNMFDRIIPLELCKLDSLHILDLADNHLSGIIPSCFGNLNGMKYNLDDQRYEGELLVVAKGRNLLYRNTLFLVNSIDLSSNNLSGQIPPSLSGLHRLGTLNVSNNHLVGRIPENIGGLGIMETLDLSRNKLTGPFPATMTDLTALNYLNVSYNNLWGKIPTKNQFATLIDPSIYSGNPGLCGFPLPNACRNGKSLPESLGRGGEQSKKDEFDKLGLLLSVALGFIVGFWGVCGALVVKRSWRIAYFQFVDEFKDRLVLGLVLNFIHLCRIMKQWANNWRLY